MPGQRPQHDGDRHAGPQRREQQRQPGRHGEHADQPGPPRGRARSGRTASAPSTLPSGSAAISSPTATGAGADLRRVRRGQRLGHDVAAHEPGQQHQRRGAAGRRRSRRCRRPRPPRRARPSARRPAPAGHRPPARRGHTEAARAARTARTCAASSSSATSGRGTATSSPPDGEPGQLGGLAGDLADREPALVERRRRARPAAARPAPRCAAHAASTTRRPAARTAAHSGSAGHRHHRDQRRPAGQVRGDHHLRRAEAVGQPGPSRTPPTSAGRNVSA